MRSLGYRVEVDALGNVVGTLGAGDAGGCVLFDAHMDTVGVTDPAAWKHSLEGEIAGGRLYGRGAMDMKGPLAACVHGVAAARDRLRGGRMVVSATVAEELVKGPALAAVEQGPGHGPGARARPACGAPHGHLRLHRQRGRLPGGGRGVGGRAGGHLRPFTVYEAKLRLMLFAGALVLRVRAGYETAFRLSRQSARVFGWLDRNTGINPATIEAKKTVALEMGAAGATGP
jgi:hypothetical protein